ncbi:MAG: B12-binding domain-containing radical SAM protein [Candidatus Omnitrophica bacterium]|nr:B12-binding domain-containing radical SAM protein [Candidatus Omnitrophota bacterium]
MKLKVMFLYPNLRGMNMVPPAIGLLSAVLKGDGHSIRLFDTTYYEHLDDKSAEADSDQTKVDLLMARPFKMPQEITLKTSNVFDDFRKEVNEFSPDLIAVSATEDMFLLGVKLIKSLGEKRPLTILGGVFATFAPDLALSFKEIDIICRGEGEFSLKELCNRIAAKQNIDDIPNLWIKSTGGKIKKNRIEIADMDSNPLIDMSIFEEARFYRPMGGKVYRMFPVETNRGCPFQCTYCNSPSQVRMYREECNQNFLRRKSADKIRRELLFYKNEMKAEYLYFWADTFFCGKDEEFYEFAEMYREINLPFWCQTRLETVTESRMKKLKAIGCARMSLGIEHGNEKFRRDVLKRNISNDEIIKNCRIINDSGIPFSVNNIIGFPYETYELAFDTIKLNRMIDSIDRNAYQFTPFHGTKLRAVCEELGFIKPDAISESLVVGRVMLNMPQFPADKIKGLVKAFNLYVKFPESRWHEIKKAEEDTIEGNKIYDKLKEEFKAVYF